MSQYITAEEVITLSAYATVEDIYISKDIVDAYTKAKPDSETEWVQACAIAAVYNAGRVAGIREERAKRHQCAKAQVSKT